MRNDAIAKRMLLNLNRKEFKVKYEGFEYTFYEPSIDEVQTLEASDSWTDLLKVLDNRQADGDNIKTLGVTTQLYIMKKYIDWVTRIMTTHLSKLE